MQRQKNSDCPILVEPYQDDSLATAKENILQIWEEIKVKILADIYNEITHNACKVGRRKIGDSLTELKQVIL